MDIAVVGAVRLVAKFMKFGGWKMLVQYASIIDEHNVVRTSAGVFWYGSMGTFTVTGENTEKFLNYVALGNMSGLPGKKARYSILLNERYKRRYYIL